jgi:tRNA 2-thiouridine synthesizing protein A
MESSMKIDQELDTCGLNCPLPILKTKKALATMESGQMLKIISNDCGSVKDMASFANQTGHELVSQSEEDGKYFYFMKKK